MAYRKARSIELYELGVAFATTDAAYGCYWLPGRGDQPTKPVFKIPLVDVINAASALGLDATDLDDLIDTPHNSVSEQTCTNEYNDKHHYVKRGNYEVNVYRRICDVSTEDAGAEVVSLEAEVLGANLVNVKVGTLLRGDEAATVDEITYSGPFTVWWASESES